MARRRQNVSFSSFSNLFSFFGPAPSLGIDLGSLQSRIYIQGKGIALREHTYVAYNKKTQKYFAAGSEAYDMLGKTPPDLVVSSPIIRGRVSDFDGLQYFLQTITERATGKKGIGRWNGVMSVPIGLTEVEEMAIVEVGKKVGARSVRLVETPIAAGFGLHAPVLENIGTCVLDMGGGTTEVSVISLGGIVLSRVLAQGGGDCNEAIANYIRVRYGLLIGQKTAEDIKRSLGPMMHPDDVQLEIHGRSIETGMPKAVKMKNYLIYEALYPLLGKIIEAVREVVEETPPELISDITKKGILMTGGSSRFPQLPQYLSQEIGVKMHAVDDASDSTIKGLGWLIEHQQYLDRVGIRF